MIADDVYVLGPPAAAAAAFQEYRGGVEDAGGAVNLAKSVAWSPTAVSLQCPDIQQLGVC